jgi:hypothetical protein
VFWLLGAHEAIFKMLKKIRNQSFACISEILYVRTQVLGKNILYVMWKKIKICAANSFVGASQKFLFAWEIKIVHFFMKKLACNIEYSDKIF